MITITGKMHGKVKPKIDIQDKVLQSYVQQVILIMFNTTN